MLLLASFLFACIYSTQAFVLQAPAVPLDIPVALYNAQIIGLEVWIYRTASESNMTAAFNSTYSNANTYHIVQDAGDFGPYPVASSYDFITIFLPQFFGFAPFSIYTMFDSSTIQYLGNNTWRVDYVINTTTRINATTIGYDEQGFRSTDYFRFANGTTQVELDYGVQDPALIKLSNLVTSSFSPEQLCFLIFAACNGSDAFNVPPQPYLVDTGFSTLEECITFMYALPSDPNNTICPYVDRSNTTNCRTIHMLSSFIDPSIHCAHVRPDSALCVNTCLPACDNCDINASCRATYVSIPYNFTPVYACECNNGYVGNGSHCTPKACSYGNCPAAWGSYDCSGDNLCKCTETFTPNPTDTTGSNLCTCPAPSQLFWNGDILECVPKGRCLNGQQWQCTSQSYNDVKCTTYGNNTFTLFNDCLCNYGFLGGWEYPCSCPSPKRSFYSNSYSGNICLQPWECQFSWQCGYPLTCHVPTGQQIGSCVNSKKRFITNQTDIPCQFTWQCGYPATCQIKGGEQFGTCAY